MPHFNFSRSYSYAILAKDMAQAIFSKTGSRQKLVQERIGKRLGNMRGLPQKVGQMLSFRQSEGFDSPFAELQESAEPMPLNDVLVILKREWPDLDFQSLEIDTHGKAASIGQVHRADLPVRGEVAVKVRFPGIEESVKDDLKTIQWLSLPFGNLGAGFDIEAYRSEIQTGLNGELDYRLEAENQSEFAKLWYSNDNILIPEVFDERSSKKVLVSRWLEGEHASEVSDCWDAQSLKKLSQLLLDFFLQGIFQHGVMQADWHPGNLRFRRAEGQVQMILYDFGCVCRLSKIERLALAKLIQTTISGVGDPIPIFQKLGFNPELLDPISDKIPAVCRTLFEPFCSSIATSTSSWRLSERMSDILGDDRWNFRMAGPPRLIFLLRAFQGLFFYLNQWQQPVDWQCSLLTVLRPLQSDIDHLSLPVSSASASFRKMATKLIIKVVKDGRTAVQISHPARNIERLEELLDDRMRAKIETQGIDLKEVVARARQVGYAPNELLRVDNGDCCVKVLLK